MIWYMLGCRDCGGDPDHPLMMPFGSAEERGHWAADHTRATGHMNWWAPDVDVEESGGEGS